MIFLLILIALFSIGVCAGNNICPKGGICDSKLVKYKSKHTVTRCSKCGRVVKKKDIYETR